MWLSIILPTYYRSVFKAALDARWSPRRGQVPRSQAYARRLRRASEDYSGPIGAYVDYDDTILLCRRHDTTPQHDFPSVCQLLGTPWVG